MLNLKRAMRDCSPPEAPLRGLRVGVVDFGVVFFVWVLLHFFFDGYGAACEGVKLSFRC